MFDDVFFRNRPSFAEPAKKARLLVIGDILEFLARVIDYFVHTDPREDGMQNQKNHEDQERRGQRSDKA